MFVVLDFAVGGDDGDGQGGVGVGIGVSIGDNSGGSRVAAELAAQGVGVADEGDAQVGVSVQGGQGARYRFRGAVVAAHGVQGDPDGGGVWCVRHWFVTPGSLPFRPLTRLFGVAAAAVWR